MRQDRVAVSIASIDLSWILACFAVLLFSTAAHTTALYMAPASAGGSDANDCLTPSTPCASPARIVALLPFGQQSSLNLLPGRYVVPLDLVRWKYLDVGPMGLCTDPSAIQWVVPEGEVGLQAQDGAQLIVECMTITTTGVGSVAIKTRAGGSIIDTRNVWFGYFPGGTHMLASDHSRINCIGDNKIIADAQGNAGATSHISVDDHATVYMACVTDVTVRATFNQFGHGATYGLIDLSAAKFLHPENVVGKQHSLDNASIMRGEMMPGRQ
jgi:hypothetical protein